MPDALPPGLVQERMLRVLDALERSPHGLRTSELQVELGLGEHPTTAVVRALEAAGRIRCNGRATSGRRWLLVPASERVAGTTDHADPASSSPSPSSPPDRTAAEIEDAEHAEHRLWMAP